MEKLDSDSILKENYEEEYNEEDYVLYYIPAESEVEEIRRIQNIAEVSKENRKKQKEIIEKIIKKFSNERFQEENEKQKNELEKAIKEVFDLEMEQLEEKYPYKLQIYIEDEEEDNLDGMYDYNDYIEINIKNNFEYLESDNPEQRKYGIKQIFSTVFHEIEHHRQYQMSLSEVSSKEAIKYAQDYALITYIERRFYNENWGALALENDAEGTAVKALIEILGYSLEKEVEMLIYDLNKKSSLLITNDVKSNSGEEFDMVEQDREEATEKILDTLITQRKETEILEDYPILKKKYHEDGTKRTVKELIENMIKEKIHIANMEELKKSEKKLATQQSEEMYLELIYQALKTTTKEEISQINKYYLKRTLAKMKIQAKKEMKDNFREEKDWIYARNKYSLEIASNPIIKAYEKAKIYLTHNAEISKAKKWYQKQYRKKIKIIDSILKTGEPPKEYPTLKEQIRPMTLPIRRGYKKTKETCNNFKENLKVKGEDFIESFRKINEMESYNKQKENDEEER